VTSVYCNINRITVGKKEVSSNIKIRVPKTVYVPPLLYDSESWTMLTKHESRITGTELRHLRKCMGKTRRDGTRNRITGTEMRHLRKCIDKTRRDRIRDSQIEGILNRDPVT